MFFDHFQYQNKTFFRWKIEVNQLSDYFGLGPKSYQMLYYVENETQSPQLVSRIKNKGFSFLNHLMKGNLINLPRDLIMDRLHSGDSGLQCGLPGALVVQENLRINPQTLIPTHKISFKKLQPNGPQMLLQISDYCLFGKKGDESSEITNAVVVETKNQTEKICHEFSVKNPDLPLIPKSFAAEMGKQHQCNYRPVELAGLLPTLPFGYKFSEEINEAPWRIFQYRENEKTAEQLDCIEI